MSKDQVLNQIHPEEVEMLYQKKRDKEIKRYEGYVHQLLAFTAGFGGKTESGESLYEIYMKELNEKLDKLQNIDARNEDKEYTPESIEKELDKLRGLQGVINKKKQSKRR